MASAAAFTDCGLRPFTTTEAPAPARPSAIARPMPRVLPVTIPTFPLSENGSSIIFCGCLVIFAKDRQFFRFERALGMNGQHRLIAAEFTCCQIRDHVERP